MLRTNLAVASLALLLGTLFLPLACGGGTATVSDCPGGPDCTCSDEKTCSCADSGGCGFACATDGCNLACGANATCEGSCGKDCNVSCPEGSACDIDLGVDGDMACTNADCEITANDQADVTCDGGSCNVTCTGACDVACINEAVCQIKCAGDADFKPIETAGKCEG